jgi:hypothetical protein
MANQRQERGEVVEFEAGNYCGIKVPEKGRPPGTEAKMYLHLGKPALLVRMISFSYEDGLCLEYMPNGDLRDYLRQYKDTMSRKQRHK